MIDLHIHTHCSDGTDTPIQVLQKAADIGLEVISITDHNSCNAYKELNQCRVHLSNAPKVIIGCEFTTSFAGRLIEVLGYGFDYQKIDSFLHQNYGDAATQKRNNALRSRLEQNIKKLGLTFDKNQLRPLRFSGERMERPYYDELITHRQNRIHLSEPIWDTFGNFYRKGTANPSSAIALHYGDFFPTMPQVAEQIHRAGGIAFLAHPFQYRFQEIDSFLENIYAANQLDGVECFHTTFIPEQMQYLTEFARKHRLLVSGGSDYHGLNKTQHNLGVGCGNLHIETDILESWPEQLCFWQQPGGKK